MLLGSMKKKKPLNRSLAQNARERNENKRQQTVDIGTFLADLHSTVQSFFSHHYTTATALVLFAALLLINVRHPLHRRVAYF